MIAHQTVLLNEAVEGLAIVPDGFYIDATFGRGGHSQKILETLGEQGHLLALDRDPAAIESGRQFAADPRFKLVHSDFAQLEACVVAEGWQQRVNGILLDLGVSSPQLDEAERGFSFMKIGPLDMRMDPTRGEPASAWIARVSEADLADVFYEYGDERYARRIASAVVKARKEAPFETTVQLAEVIKAAHPKWERGQHPATRCFQAIRIYLNDELNQLRTVLEQALNVLAPKGRIAVIAFHSLEDRIVKRFFRDEAQNNVVIPRRLPIKTVEQVVRLKPVGPARRPSEQEIENNPRARSAILRVAEKQL